MLLQAIQQHVSGTQLSAESAFEAAVRHCESPQGVIPEEVPKLLRHVFDTDFKQQLLENVDLRTVHNVTCMRPADGVDTEAFGCFNDELLRVPLQEGRACAGGLCGMLLPGPS